MKNKFTTWLTMLLAVLFIFSAQSNCFSAQKDSDVIATVGNYKLTTGYLLREVRSLPPRLQMVLVKNPQLLNRFVNRWINITLMAVAARKAGIDKRPVIRDQIQDSINTLLARTWATEKIKGKLNITESEIKKYYEEHKAKEFTEPEMVKARHILIRVPLKATKAQVAKAKAEAEKIYRMLKNGADFAKLAKKYSGDPGSSMRGGELGFFPKGRMIPKFEKVAFSMKVGQISKPFRTKFGFEIVQVQAKRPATVLPLKAVRGNIKQRLIQQAQRDRLDKLIKELRETYKVQINKDVLENVAKKIGISGPPACPAKQK